MAISEETLTEINDPNTRIIVVNSENINDDEAIELAHLLKDKANIKKVFAYGNAIGDFGARALLSLPQLEELNLSNSHFSEEVIIEMAPYLRLKRLMLGDTLVSARGLASLLANPYLEMLYVTHCPITESELLNVTLPTNHTLQQLYLSNPIGDKGLLRLIASLTKLDALSIRNCNNTNAGIKTLLTQGKQLKFLSVGGELITDDAFAPLKESGYDGQLEKLEVIYTNVGTKTMKYLLENRILTSAYFSASKLTAEEENLLKQHLEQNRLNKQFGILTIDTADKAAKKNANQFGQSSNFFQDKQKIKGQSPQVDENAMVCTP